MQRGNCEFICYIVTHALYYSLGGFLLIIYLVVAITFGETDITVLNLKYPRS